MTKILPYRNQPIDFLCKSMGWFLYHKDFCFERGKLPPNGCKFLVANFKCVSNAGFYTCNFKNQLQARKTLFLYVKFLKLNSNVKNESCSFPRNNKRNNIYSIRKKIIFQIVFEKLQTSTTQKQLMHTSASSSMLLDM